MQPSPERILVIDDESGMCRLLDTVLSGEGYEVVTSQKPTLALALLKAEHFDLVLTDIRMPKVNGLEILEAVKSFTPEIPVILITAFATLDSAVRAIKSGASDYVLKPFRNDQIKLAVYRVLERRRLLDENKRLRSELAARPPAGPVSENAVQPVPDQSSYRDAKHKIVNAFEREYLERLLARAGGNISRAAAWADMDRKNFYDLLKKHHLYTP